MSLEFITTANRWNEVFALLPDFAGKIYYSHAYYTAMQANGDGQACALLYCKDSASGSFNQSISRLPDLKPVLKTKPSNKTNVIPTHAEIHSSKIPYELNKVHICSYDNALNAPAIANNSSEMGSGNGKICNTVFYPFLLKPVPVKVGGNGFFDLETAYGYGGPVAFNCDLDARQDFACLFANWALQQNIVAEFVRFNPLTANHTDFADLYNISHNRITVSMPLTENFATVLQGCTQPRQRNYRRAIREGLIFRQLPDLSEFCELYLATMHRLNAGSYYYFSPACFKELEKIPETNRFFAGVYTTSGDLAASAIFLIDEQSAHYHLGASDEKFKDTQATAFMMLEFAKLALQSNKQLLHLGGGLSLAADDPLFRFKAGFANSQHDFFIGRKIHQSVVYQNLSNRWHELTGAKPEILLHYHYGANNENL